MMRRTIISAISAVLLGIIPAAVVTVRAQAPSGPREGIVVHGHWVIDVRDPDGRLVTHREFDNALVTSGATLLSDILAGRSTKGAWFIVLSAQTLQPCFGQVGFDPSPKLTPCQISSLSGNPGVTFQTLALSSTGLVLSGTATASAPSGRIENVATALGSCPASSSPSIRAPNATVLSNAFPTTFSSKALSPAIDVVAGQAINVTVTFTFS